MTEQEIKKINMVRMIPPVVIIVILIATAITLYPELRNMSEKMAVMDQINSEIELQLDSYANSQEYMIVNPAIQADKLAIENTVNSDVSNIDAINSLYSHSIEPSPYLYITKKDDNGDYEVFEAYTNIISNMDNTFTVNNISYSKVIDIFTYTDGEFIKIKTNDYNKQISAVGTRKTMGFIWFISMILILGIGIMITIRFSDNN